MPDVQLDKAMRDKRPKEHVGDDEEEKQTKGIQRTKSKSSEASHDPEWPQGIARIEDYMKDRSR